MKLLFDQNLSPRLVDALTHLFPGSTHVRDVALARADDMTVWEFAAQHGYAIVSKDSDFRQLSFLQGAPPKVIWIRRGNCTTREIEHILRLRHRDILTFDEDPEASFLALAQQPISPSA